MAGCHYHQEAHLFSLSTGSHTSMRALCHAAHNVQGCTGSTRHSKSTLLTKLFSSTMKVHLLTYKWVKKKIYFCYLNLYLHYLPVYRRFISLFLTVYLNWHSPDLLKKPYILCFLFEGGAARVRRSTSTTAPGFTFLVTTCAGSSHLSCSLSSSVRLRRALSPMGMFHTWIHNISCQGHVMFLMNELLTLMMWLIASSKKYDINVLNL